MFRIPLGKINFSHFWVIDKTGVKPTGNVGFI